MRDLHNNTASAIQKHVDFFKEQENLICKDCAPSLNNARHTAICSLSNSATSDTLGALTSSANKDSEKDINATAESRRALEPLWAINYGMNLRRLPVSVSGRDLFHCEVPSISARPHYFINDQYHATVSSHASANSSCASPCTFSNTCSMQVANASGILIGSLNEMAKKHPELVGHYYDRLAGCDGQGDTVPSDAATSDNSRYIDQIAALNTAFAQDGLFVYVPQGVQSTEITQLVNLSTSLVDLMTHRRLLIVIEDGASFSLLSCDHSLDAVRFLGTQVAEIYVGHDATFNFYDLEETHKDTTRLFNMYVRQADNSTVNVCTLTLHNGITHNRVRACLAGQGAHLNIKGLALSDKKQYTETDTVIDHAVPLTTAEELYKYVLDGESKATFVAKTLVRPHAQKTNSRQTAKALCLTSQARLFAQPNLEIYADDVKCSHGAGIGQLDEAALFFMQQRGIGRVEARYLLLVAFLSDVIDDIHIPTLADRLRHLLDKRLRGELRECEGCKTYRNDHG